MNGYKNAPQITPQIGDIVECGLPGETAAVASVDDRSGDTNRPAFTNCAFDGKLSLNMPGEATLVRTVDGREPTNTS